MWGKQRNWEAVGSTSSRMCSLSKGSSCVSGAADSRIFKPPWIPCHSRQRPPWNGSGGPLAYFLSRSLPKGTLPAVSTSDRILSAGHSHATLSPELADVPQPVPLSLLGSQASVFSGSHLSSYSRFPGPFPFPRPGPCPSITCRAIILICLLPFFLYLCSFFELRGTGLHKSYSCSWHFLIKDPYVAFSQFLLVGHLEKGNGLGSSGNPLLFCSRLVGDECVGQSAQNQRGQTLHRALQM